MFLLKKKALKINIIQYHNIIVADERIGGGGGGYN